MQNWYNITKQLLITLLGCITANVVLAQQPFVKSFWLNKKQIPQTVYDIKQDKWGYLWLATANGVIRYNGIDFVQMRDSLQLPVKSLLCTESNTYSGYKSGNLGIVEYNKINAFQPRGYKHTVPVNQIVADDNNSIWLASDEGIWHINPSGEAQHYLSEINLSDNYIYRLCFTKDKKLLAATDKGLNIINLSGKVKVEKYLNVSDGLPDNIITSIEAFDNNKYYWTGTQNGGIALYDHSRQAIIPLHARGEWHWGQINDIRHIEDSRALIATNSGYLIEAVLEEELKISLNVYANLMTKINCIYTDPMGNIWCGTDNGLTLVLTGLLSYLPISEPYNLTDVTAIACDYSGIIWIALDKSLYYLSGQNGNLVHVANVPVRISSLYTDKQNRLWAGTMGKGLWYKIPNQNRIRSAGIDTLEKTFLLSISGRDNTIWAAGLNGIFTVKEAAEDEFVLDKHFNKSSGTGSDYIYHLYSDSKKNIWVASDGAGVSMYNGKEFKRWKEFDEGNNKVVYSVTEDNDGNIWAATFDNRLLKYGNDKWQQFSIKNNNSSGDELSLITSNINDFVISVYQDRIEYYSHRHNRSWAFELSNWFEKDIFSNVLNCYTKDTAGNIYIPFSRGIVKIKNNKIENHLLPQVVIQKITNNGVTVDNSRTRYKANENYFTFLFDGVMYSDAKNHFYRYKLEGYNNEWTHSNISYATFPKLPAGKYIFRVQVASDEFFNNSAESIYAFEILLPFWKTWWFILSVTGLCGISIYAYNKIRISNLKRIATIKQERMIFEYEYLRSQINPHFLFNSLNTLTGMIEDQPEKAVVYTEKLSDLYRNTINYLDKNLISLKEELEILSNYITVQQHRFGKALQFNIAISEEVQNTKQIVPMAMQFIVENAIKHNVISTSEPLVINVFTDEDYIWVTNKINLKVSHVKESKIGLKNIQKRYMLHTNQKIMYGEVNGFWEVKLPLI